MNSGNIVISIDHFNGIVKLVGNILEIDESAAQKLVEALIGKQGKAKYRHLQLDREAVREEAVRLDIEVPRALFNDLNNALQLVGVQTPICPKCQALPIANRGGSWTLLLEGNCPGGCGSLIKSAEVVTKRFDWTTGAMVAADITENLTFDPANPVPLTEAGIRKLVRVHSDVDAALETEEANLIDLCHGWLQHPDYAHKFGNDPHQVLVALENPRGSGFMGNALQLAARNTKGWRRVVSSAGNDGGGIVQDDLYEALCKLGQSMFGTVVFHLNVKTQYMSAESTALAIRATELLRVPGISRDQIWAAVRRVRGF